MVGKTLKLNNGAELPIIGLGTFLARDPKELEVALNAALELGYRHIDTAWVYENEKIIGRVLKQWFDSGKLKREDLFITTKLPIVGVHPDRVERFIKESLSNLQLDYVDLYLVHFPIGGKFEEGLVRPKIKENGETDLEGKTDHAGLWKKLEQQVDLGRTKAIGLSNYSIGQIQTVLKTARIKPANLQVEVHVYLQQNDLVNFCLKNGISVVAYSPLVNPGLPVFLEALGVKRERLPHVVEDKVLAKIGKKHNKTNAQVAIRFLMQRGLSVIPKSVNPKRIKENFEVFDFELDDTDMKTLYGLEIGETARSANFKLFMKGVDKHPDYPFAPQNV